MSSHNASGQMLGYLYQVRYALYLLLTCENPDHQISLEKFDDVAFDNDGSPKELIQLKHHGKAGDLSDASTDLWRTLKVWIDMIRNGPSLTENTDFLIITTAMVPDNSAADMIKKKKYEKAREILVSVAKTSQSKTNEKFYKAVIDLDAEMPDLLGQLIRHIKITSSTNNIIDVEKRIRTQLRYACRPEHEDFVLERLEGWWFQECVRALASPDPVITNQNQLRNKINEISDQYKADNLPIEFWDLDVDKDSLKPKDRIFLQQLELLQCKNKTLQLAIRDYYRAFMQRSSWIREGLVYSNELESYEQRLIDEWEHAYAEMEDELEDYGDSLTEEEKIKAGKKLYKEIMNKDIRIRERVDAFYIMKGTYHDLANRLDVGWHVDFYERLKSLLEGV